ncbi:MAG TPA: NAD(P)H-hydrate dehydratase [Thermoanaerobaculia bacterium]|nr:NAD(P)H-hydrate dehydratase [Thermoanaerobaculia bacterium]
MKILTSEQMASIDRRAIEQFLIPSIVLMENAAAAVCQAIAERFPEADSIAIFCGSGNNGGDGLAIARHLEGRGVTPLVILLGNRQRYSGDARTNLSICERLGLPIMAVDSSESLDHALARASQTDLLVDAIFGTGLDRPPGDTQADAIRGMMSLRLPIVAVDLPSGTNGSSAEPFEPAIRADLTVTFAQPKIAHVFEPSASQCGELIIADISIPHSAVEAENVTLSLITADEVALVVPRRDPASHKGTHGHVAIVAGSAGKSGAAILGARGALRGGAGLVTVITDPATAAIVDCASIESMTIPIALTLESAGEIASMLERFSAVMIGPGLPDDEATHGAIRSLVEAIELPLVLDATAVNAFSGAAGMLNRRRLPRIITPHPGELARLLETDTASINGDRTGSAARAAALSGCVAILKGHQTIVADPDGRLAVNPTGNAGMASGGMGDVLAGLLAALLASGLDPFEGASAAVFLHGLAGDLLQERFSDRGLLARELADLIPAAFEKVRSDAR